MNNVVEARLTAQNLDPTARFLVESNAIEGIHTLAPHLIEDIEMLWSISNPSVYDIAWFAKRCQRSARLRDIPSMTVRVGSHIAPPGGPQIKDELATILQDASDGEHPYLIHHRFETLHPFTDGNGRSGRALWAWQMLRQGIEPGIDLGFLHAFYYQTLEFSGPDAQNDD